MSKPDALRVLDHNELFCDEAYQSQFEAKRPFEGASEREEVERVAEWSRSWDYRERNFAREALVVNPAKACQPLGAILAAIGFERTLPLVHGSQGCVAYFRSHFSRHFKEPFPAVSSSMTEDAAVFGGLANLTEAMENATALYKPDMIALSTTCMAEVIGDDLRGFILGIREKGTITDDFPVPSAHTPSFVGSHVTGYDNMLRGILSYLADDAPITEPNGKLNIICGFDPYVGDIREVGRLLDLMGVSYTLLGDHSDAMDSPATGEYQLYSGGTTRADAADARNATATVCLQRTASAKTAQHIAEHWEQEVVTVPMPIGVANTDRFLTEVARLTGAEIPPELEAERGRLIDAMTDSHAYLHGKRVAVAGDPDLVVGLLGFLLEMGAEPVHVVCTNADAKFKSEAEAVLASSPFGAGATVWPGKDLWHLRSLVHTEPVDLLVGNSYVKQLSRETGVPLVRIGFPVFDRHHLHRYPIIGYEGGLNVYGWLVNTVLDELDRAAPEHSFDMVR